MGGGGGGGVSRLDVDVCGMRSIEESGASCGSGNGNGCCRADRRVRALVRSLMATMRNVSLDDDGMRCDQTKNFEL